MVATPGEPPPLALAASDQEAEARFETWRQRDPFPEIRPALLNSADIADYVTQTGMIYPFYPERLKSASYPIRLLGEYLYWDEDGNEISEELAGASEFILKKNSIAFVTLEPTFRFPDYIAGRFNLKIPNVYRGLLLGTGPLVDPGWTGRLSFPLHNLTTNDYIFRGGEEVIWMEFTKLSENDRWLDRTVVSPKRAGTYALFHGDRGLSVRDRVALAAPNTAVSSSLASALSRADDAATAATAAEKTARDLARRYSAWGGVAVVAALATIIALAIQVLLYKQPAPKVVTTTVSSPAATQVAALQRTEASLSRRLRVLERQIARLRQANPGG